MSDKEYEDLVRNVPLAYDDFINYLCTQLDPEEKDMVADFIKKNPEANSGNVLTYYTEYVDDDWSEDDE